MPVACMLRGHPHGRRPPCPPHPLFKRLAYQGYTAFLGERRLKDIDEPERIFELEIEGVEQTPAELPPEPPTARPGEAPPTDALDARAEDFSRRLSNQINQRVFESLERTLGDLGKRK